MLKFNSIIRVQTIQESGEFRVEYVNLEHIQRFYAEHNHVVIELTGNVKLKLTIDNVDLLFEQLFIGK